MHKKTLLLITFLYTTSFASVDVIPYVSPGFEIGFGRFGTTFSTKISIGVLTTDMQFVNITYGRAFPSFTNSTVFKDGYRFVEFEGGVALHSAIFVGGGAGVAFVPDDGIKVLPKFSLFGGSVLFFRTDHILYPRYKNPIINTYGVIVVLPVSPLMVPFLGG